MTSRILIFSPYAWRPHFTLYEGTIAKACQIRGATVEYLLCDGLLPECDNHWDSYPENRPRPFDLCQRCQSGAKAMLAEFDLPYRWLGEFVSEVEREQAFTWAQSLSPSELRHACFMGDPVGEWVQSSVVSYFRNYPPDMNNWRVVNVYRGFLCSASIVAIGLRNYLIKHSTESALLFNGRQSLNRAAFEIYKQFGIRELTHEFPYYQRGHIMVKPNAKCWSIEPFTEFWSNWGQVPLSSSSLEKTLKWLRNRRYGKELSWYAFNAPQTNDLSIRKSLNLSMHKRLLALFTSSTDETAGDPELQGPYESQAEWVQDILNWVEERSDVELVIRVHPHLAGNTGLQRAHGEFDFYDRMRLALPANTRLIMPDDTLNSYALMDEADVCLSFGSSVGLEMAMLGKPVVLASRGIYEDGQHILNVRSKKSLSEMLEKSLHLPFHREIRREAFRMAYYYVFVFEFPFPLVSMVGVRDVKLNYAGPEALVPEQDASLDHICNFLIYGHPLFDTPNDAERARTTLEEDIFFENLEKLSEPMRDLEYERLLQRSILLNVIGRNIQSVLMSLPFGFGKLLDKIGKSVYLPLLHRVKRKI